MLQNEYLLAKIGFDTAENEPFLIQFCLIFIAPRDLILTERSHPEVLDKSGRPVGTERAWVYHRTGKFERDVAQRIPDGDWLSRRRGDSPAPAASSKGTVADAVAKDVVQDATPPRFGMELSIYDLPEYPRSTTTS